MILAFMTKWPKQMGPLAGKPTNFVEKIWKSFPNQPLTEELVNVVYSGNFEFNVYNRVKPKKHTIRYDWRRINMPIHYYINSRKPDMMKFFPEKPCVFIQDIVIKHTDNQGVRLVTPEVYIHGVMFTDVERLATNDGFDNVEDFFMYFNSNFTGKIIHWTNLKY